MNDRLKVSTVVISDVHLGSEHSKVDELTRFLKSGFRLASAFMNVVFYLKKLKLWKI